MEGHNDASNGPQSIAGSSESSEGDVDPPWQHYSHSPYSELIPAEVYDDDHHIQQDMITRIDIENSIKKFEELLEERNNEATIYEDIIALEHKENSEEERSKSDGETEDHVRGEESEILHEERSKSDGEKEGEKDEDDDTVPLKIQAVELHKSNKLGLSNCWLKTVPSEVWNLVGITELDLSANYLKKVSKSIGNLGHLKKLSLNHNQLSVLPKEIFSLTKLTSLFLNNNSLKAVPKDIKNLIKLKTLDLSSNQITELSNKEGILLLTNLTELRLRNNLLSTIPVMMADMSNLQVLWLEGNPLASVPKSLLKKPASMILSYVKEHPQTSKKVPDSVLPRALRKSPPLVAGKLPFIPATPHGKKDLNLIAEKELKKRKREQLEEMRKHIEVEKKVKLLEHELMIANAKALKFQEEARKVEEQKLLDSPPHPQQAQQHQIQQIQQQIQQIQQQQIQFYALPPRYAPLKDPKEILKDQEAREQFEWEIPFSELLFGPRIGRGGYGEVFRAMWGGTEVAAKMLFTDNMNAKLLSDLRKEVELLCKLRHPNILLFMGACTEPETPCIVTEYLSRGSLASLLSDESIVMDWSLKLQIAIDCARGMAYLHSRNPVIIHRDLKTDNLLVDDNWQVKVADFGLATVKSRTFAKTMCGTTGWTAPEVLAEQGYTEKADVYSFAIILWELLTRQIPYAGKNTMQVVRSVDRGERLSIPPNCPEEYANLLRECWENDPAKRPSFGQILPRMEGMRAKYLESLKHNPPPAEPIPVECKDDNMSIEKKEEEPPTPMSIDKPYENGHPA